MHHIVLVFFGTKKKKKKYRLEVVRIEFGHIGADMMTEKYALFDW